MNATVTKEGIIEKRFLFQKLNNKINFNSKVLLNREGQISKTNGFQITFHILKNV